MKTQRIRVRLDANGYDVTVREDLDVASLRSLSRTASRCFLLTDAHVHRRVLPKFKAALDPLGITSEAVIVLPAGESSKNLRSFAAVQRRLLQLRADRKSLLLGLGGGMITDLAGFVAATYMRGIDWVALPTTLLGMVDAAIGGKTGINFARLKNSVGAFHQPKAVMAVTSWLATLPAAERRSGLGEVVKYAMIADAALFRDLEKRAVELRSADAEMDARLVGRCCRIKARFVAADERESGVRESLNFGHTIGHALEEDGRNGLRHGEAVGLGMLAACRLAFEMGLSGESIYERLRQLLQSLGLPLRPQRTPSLQQLQRSWSRDKKARRGRPRFVLTPRIGRAQIGVEVDEPSLAKAIAAAWAK